MDSNLEHQFVALVHNSWNKLTFCQQMGTLYAQ